MKFSACHYIAMSGSKKETLRSIFIDSLGAKTKRFLIVLIQGFLQYLQKLYWGTPFQFSFKSLPSDDLFSGSMFVRRCVKYLPEY